MPNAGDEKKRKREDELTEPLSIDEMTKAREKLLANSEKEKQVLESAERALADMCDLLKKELAKEVPTLLSQEEVDKLGIKNPVEWFAKGECVEAEVAKKGEESLKLLTSFTKRLAKMGAQHKESLQKGLPGDRGSKSSRGGGVASDAGRIVKELRVVSGSLEDRVKVLEEKVGELEHIKSQLRRLEKLLHK